MNKLLKTTLITAVLSTGAMASEMTGALPRTIESEATVYVNKDTILETSYYTTIDNYGTITTECNEGSYPTISASTDTPLTINNHGGVIVEEETNTDTANKIKEDNIIEGITLDKIYKITEMPGGTIDKNIIIGDGITVINASYDVNVADISTYIDNELLYLGAENPDRTIKIKSDKSTTSAIHCGLGDNGAKNTYNLEMLGKFSLFGDISNFKNGSITVNCSGTEYPNTSITFNTKTRQELRVPITMTSGEITFIGSGVDIYSEINSTNGKIRFSNSCTLKSGAVLRLGEAPGDVETIATE